MIITDHRDDRPLTIAAPRDWDGVGQALRAAYGNHRDLPNELADALHKLDVVD